MATLLSRVGTTIDVSASRDAFFVLVFNALKPSHAMMASSLLIKLRREHITAALHETIFQSVYRCEPDHFFRI
jgi:hypothetical protein